MTKVIDEEQLRNVLGHVESNSEQIDSVLAKASAAQGLSLAETGVLLNAGEAYDDAIFSAAAKLNQQIHGKCIILYGVCYISDYCLNTCKYCSDSSNSKFSDHRCMTEDEFKADVLALMASHNFEQLCFLTGEDPTHFGTHDLVKYLALVSTFYHNTVIINVPPLSVQDFRSIRQAVPNRLHFRVFQETYDRTLYIREHAHGPKANYDFRIESQDRALKAQFDEVGLGVLFGLNDGSYGSLFEVLALVAHAKHIHDAFGTWPRSISFPRIRPGIGLNGYLPPNPVSDRDLIRYVAIVKLAVPAAHTIITCRESAEFRRKIRPIINIEDFGAKPGPGGNLHPAPEVHFQMEILDRRRGEDVRAELLGEGYEVR